MITAANGDAGLFIVVKGDEVQLRLPPALETFGAEVRALVRSCAPAGLAELTDWTTPYGTMGRRALVDQARSHPLYQSWEGRALEARLVCPAWPEEYGGRGWDAAQLAVFHSVCQEEHIPHIDRGMGEWLVGPSVLREGTDEQKAAFLPGIVSGLDRYCQGFSEPDHGSDLAAVETRGVVDGNEIVVTGQKVWTSGAHLANKIFVLCRTDPDVPKHAGLSFVLMDFTPENNIEVRQIPLLNGIGEFAEDFFDGARAPLSHVIGGLNNGWRVAMTTLGFERGVKGLEQYLAHVPEFWAFVELARSAGMVHDSRIRQQLAWAYSNVELLRYSGMQSMSRAVSGAEGGRLEAINWLHLSQYHRRLGELAIDLDDDGGLIRPVGDGYPMTRWQDLYLGSRAGTIYSGTSEIQRNMIGERVLGLPKEPTK
ncbi:putative Acyl-CoA dehydrogenase [metagenome]|uniref:Putative Acyl-CoA dehydrogenase n=1 Tax=metagenome TaxID=256318 RepID=A0A2P2C8Q2_9ZZZZ